MRRLTDPDRHGKKLAEGMTFAPWMARRGVKETEPPKKENTD